MKLNKPLAQTAEHNPNKNLPKPLGKFPIFQDHLENFLKVLPVLTRRLYLRTCRSGENHHLIPTCEDVSSVLIEVGWLDGILFNFTGRYFNISFNMKTPNWNTLIVKLNKPRVPTLYVERGSIQSCLLVRTGTSNNTRAFNELA